MSSQSAKFERLDYYKPDEIKKFEPHHVAFARFGTDWYSVGAINGCGWVLMSPGNSPITDPEAEFAFYVKHGGRETKNWWAA